LRSRLVDREVLIVLDNASNPDQIRPLLPGTPSCRIVVTSRDDLAGLVARDGAVRVRVDRLSHGDATGVLRHLLPPSDHDDATLDQLVQLCDRLPLALRIAADRVATRVEASASEAVAELSAQPRLDALATEGDAHSAVDVVLSWSYRSVSEPVAHLFRLLGLVPGGSWDAPAPRRWPDPPRQSPPATRSLGSSPPDRGSTRRPIRHARPAARLRRRPRAGTRDAGRTPGRDRAAARLLRPGQCSGDGRRLRLRAASPSGGSGGGIGAPAV